MLVSTSPPEETLGKLVAQMRSSRIMSTPHSIIRPDLAGPGGDSQSAASLIASDSTDALLRRALRALRALSACNQSLVHAASERELLNAICRVIVAQAGYRLAWVGYALHDEAKSVRPVAHVGFEDGYLERAAITWADTERGRGPTGTAIRTRRPKACRHILTDPDFEPWRDEALKRGFASSIVLPLMDGDEAFGALNIYAAEADAFSEEEASLLGEMASDMAYGILSLRARTALRESEELYRDVFELVSDGLLVVDRLADGRFEVVSRNPQAEAVSGVADRIPPADSAEHWLRCASTGKPVVYEETRDVPGAGVRCFASFMLPLRYGAAAGQRFLIVTRDVTDQRREERRNLQIRSELEDTVERSTLAWRESERRFRELFECAPVALWVEDWAAVSDEVDALRNEGTREQIEHFPGGREAAKRLCESRVIIDANPSAVTLFGLASRAELVGQCRSRFGVSPEPENCDELKAFAGGQEVYRSEIGFRRPDGEMVHGWMAITFPQGGGVSKLALVTVADITARKRMEEALQRSEEHYRRLFETMDQGVVYQDAQGRVVSMNPAAERILGRSPAEFAGRTSIDEQSLTVREDGTPFPGLEHPAMIALRTGRSVRGVVMGVANPQDGRRHWIRIDATPLPGGSGKGLDQVYTIFDDITERLEAEHKIARQSAVLGGINRILRESLGPDAGVDEAAVLLEVGRSLTGSAQAVAAERRGGDGLDAVALNPSEWNSRGIVGAELGALRCVAAEGMLARVLNSGRGEFIECTGDGMSGPLGVRLAARRLLVAPLTDGVEVIGVIVLADKATPYDSEDLTMIQEVAPAFVEALKRKRMQAAVARLNADLAGRARELEHANRELEAFSYSVSHDLRAPLRSIEGFAEILAEDHSATLGAEGADCLSHLRAASRRMAELIDDMLMLSRASSAELHVAPADLSGIVGAIAGDLGHQDPSRKVDWKIQPGVVAPCDARLIRAALENLIGNAWKFTSKRAMARIEFGTETVGGETVYFVRDDGAGFDMTYANRLFAPFRRLHSAADFPGTGVGLATVQRIIHRHGGRVWAEGEPDHGAVIRFTLAAEARA
ncbi:phytochrome-like protein cph1 [mine drainage metagenome]|uniref:histidine kinase n=1 Tax=mine drainage metagenome TaxID=410659 RepID=A0A1J5SBV0_9ZZZZ